MARVTIKDVAVKAGVSTATVSHVINGTRFVQDETRQKVLAAIEALHYHPSSIARGLATSSTQTIGLIISDITNPFFMAVARGVEDVINQHGYHTIFCNTDEDPAREDEYLRLLSGRQIDGLIISPTGSRNERLIRMAQAELPIVLLDREAPGLAAPLVGVDNEGGAYQATRYLIDLGHDRIGLIIGLESISTLSARLEGYRRAFSEAGLTLDEQLIARADPRFYGTQPQPPDLTLLRTASSTQLIPTAYHALQSLLDLPEPPSAIFVANNQMTLGVLYALKERGLACPGEISLISFDDHDWAPLFSPPLTVIRQPVYRLGQTAASLLMRMIAKQPFEIPAPLPVELIERGSCRRLRPEQIDNSNRRNDVFRNGH